MADWYAALAGRDSYKVVRCDDSTLLLLLGRMMGDKHLQVGCWGRTRLPWLGGAAEGCMRGEGGWHSMRMWRSRVRV